MIELPQPSVHIEQSPQDARDALDACRHDANFFRLFEQPIPATRLLLIILGVLFLLGAALDHLFVQPRYGALSEGLTPILLLGAKINDAIHQGALWRLVSNTFIHVDLLHLGFNLYGLYLLGNITERLYGSRRFIALYGLSALGGAVASLYFTPAPSVGASGAIFGLFGATIVFGFAKRDLIPARLAWDLSRGMLPWLLFSLAMGLMPINIDNAAHLGGLFVGALTALVMSSPLSAETPSAPLRLGLVGLVSILITAAVLSGGLFVYHAASCLSSEGAWQMCIQAASPE